MAGLYSGGLISVLEILVLGGDSLFEVWKTCESLVSLVLRSYLWWKLLDRVSMAELGVSFAVSGVWRGMESCIIPISK